jgi:hypothetical protein
MQLTARMDLGAYRWTIAVGWINLGVNLIAGIETATSEP